MARVVKHFIGLTEALWAAIDSARGEEHRSAFLEQRLRKDRVIKAAATEKGLEFGERRKRGRVKVQKQET